jgi:glycosyltransferase involved in cell wall biosynthesis
MRLAWFSPFPPARTGIAGRSAELVRDLRARGFGVDIFVPRVTPDSAEVVSAHDFVWRHAREPYDLAVYQFGNSSHHDYIWPYALRYPGLVVLHDVRLHHARAALLLCERRGGDYRAELAFDQPEIDPDLAELAVAGFDSALYYNWPMVRSLVESARLVATHGDGAAREIADRFPQTRVRSIRLGEGIEVTPEREAAARERVRARYGIGHETVVFGCFGALTPDKRLIPILDAMVGIAPYAPDARLILGGAAMAHFDVHAEIQRRDLGSRVIVTGYLESDDELTEHLVACDVSLNLRWPTARETSGPWLRALAAGRPTIVVDLVHMADVPSIDPRTWKMNVVDDRGARGERRGANGERAANTELAIRHSPFADPICVAIDILDEDHSLVLAMSRLAGDAALRAQLGRAARGWWRRTHAVDAMVGDYVELIGEAAALPPPVVELPEHLRADGTRTLRALTTPLGLSAALSRDGLLE